MKAHHHESKIQITDITKTFLTDLIYYLSKIGFEEGTYHISEMRYASVTVVTQNLICAGFILDFLEK